MEKIFKFINPNNVNKYMSNVPDKTYMEQKQEYKDLAELAIHESMKRSRLLESDWDDIMLDIENEQFEDLRKRTV